MKSLLGDAIGDTATFIKPNPVDPPNFDVPVPRDQRTVDVIYVGRLALEKRVDLVIELARQLPNNSFRIVGDGPLRELIESAASALPNLSYLPTVSQSQALRELSQAVVTVVPSSWEEPFGRVAAEALSVGTPAIVANRGGLPDIVRDVDESLVARSDLASAWLGQLRGILNANAFEFESLVTASLRKWHQVYSPEANGTALSQIYEAAIRLWSKH